MVPRIEKADGVMKLVIGAAAALLAASALAPAAPAGAAGGTTSNFSALANGQHLAFDPSTDVLAFDSAAVSAASVRLAATSGGDLEVTAAAKTIYLDGVEPAELATTAVTFADGSVLRVGDGTAATTADGGPQTWDLSGSTKANQLWGLGGADHLIGGSGPDRFVGDAPRAIEHVTRMGNVGTTSQMWFPSVSSDGNHVAFSGGWTAFGSASDGATDVFVKDIAAGTVSDEHRDAAGTPGTSTSAQPQISGDGSWLVFASSSALVAGSPPADTIYRSSVGSNAITAVSTTADGTFANGASSSPDTSDDGRYVVFLSAATNLAPNSTGTTLDVFLKDTVTGSVQRISTSLSGGDADADANTPRMSGDGRYITFATAASNLSAVHTESPNYDVYLFDTTTDALTNVTGGLPLGDAPIWANGSIFSDVASHDGGGTVVFETGKAIATDDHDQQTDVYAYDIATGHLQAVSTDAAGAFHEGSPNQLPAVSGNGRYVVFTSSTQFTDRLDPDGGSDIYVKDLDDGSIAIASSPPNSNGFSDSADISADGRWIVFASGATNLAPTATYPVGHVFRAENPLVRDELVGGPGNDTYVISTTTSDHIVEAPGGGTDTVETTDSVAFPNTWTIPTGVENVIGPATEDDLTGNAAANRVDGGPGPDTLRGSAGNDTYVVDTASDVVRDEAAGGGTDTVEAKISWTLGSQLENLTLAGSAKINGTGNVYPNVLTGNAGINRLTGASGNDTLVDVGGNDTLDGGLDHDTYVVSSTGTTITGEGSTARGHDTVKSSTTWTLQPYLEDLVLTGTKAINGAGNTGNNVLIGNSANNVLNGDAGADTYTGGGGADQFTISTSSSVDTVNDFTVGTDRFRMRQSAWHIGDGDTTVEGATNRSGPGGFSPNAEYVVISRNLASRTTANAAAAIGSATSRYPTGARRIFVVDDGRSSEAFLFISSGNDATVSAAELKPLMVFKDRSALSVTSLLFSA